MEKLLRELFDWQIFADDPALRALIDDTQRRYDEDLTEDELSRLAAAGDPAWDLRLPLREELDL